MYSFFIGLCTVLCISGSFYMMVFAPDRAGWGWLLVFALIFASLMTSNDSK